MEIEIREACLSDAESMVGLLQPIIDAGLTVIESTSTEEQQAFISEFTKSGVFLVAIESQSGKLVGMQDVMPGEHAKKGEISTFVSMNAQGMGVGKLLFAEMLKRLSEKGYRQISASIKAGNSNAQRFYQTIGFSEFRASGDFVIISYKIPISGV